MRRSSKNDRTNRGLMCYAFLVGGALFLIMEHPVVFWAVIVPLALMFVASIVKCCRDGSASGARHIGSALLYLVLMFVVLWIVCMPS